MVNTVTTQEAAPSDTENSLASRGSSGSVTRCETPLKNAAIDRAMKAIGEISLLAALELRVVGIGEQ